MVDPARKILLHDKTTSAVTVMGVAFAVALVFVQVVLGRKRGRDKFKALQLGPIR
jgi:hypothetical protein